MAKVCGQTPGKSSHIGNHIGKAWSWSGLKTWTGLLVLDPDDDMPASIVVFKACRVRTGACPAEGRAVVPSPRVCPNGFSTKKVPHHSKCIYALCVWILLRFWGKFSRAQVQYCGNCRASIHRR
jgi:hypothetical protein